ncbi:sulfite exporter TauE/SafE family protein [Nodosilinea sp. P-1105]|uniref:sulfite exporter TauE/SafE family protein n=1 Tax=Nodosilinea sp. P-1105 TaxID=2546229 RepID=UPI00146E5F7B|nr:sulfite exporter TauE/SafE family protein [Nodosilinea sp. P-1105]NMF84247.1 sulfite exporter TauE/SafE family protein [Nodosilinea sp. P-1105]
MIFDYWYMFPIAIAIATVAMASGVEGATFFTPLFILGLGLPTEVAVGSGLITEVFGFSSGLYAYMRKQLIDYKLGQMLLLVTIPLALVGTWAAAAIPETVLKGILGVGLFAIAASFLHTPNIPNIDDLGLLDPDINVHHPAHSQTCITSAKGHTFCYTVANRTEGQLLAGIGALFLGMTSTGLGQLNGFFLIKRCRIPSPVAVATSVFVVAISALVASVGHVAQFIQAGGDTLSMVLSLVIFTAPGVLIGAQLGAIVATRLPQRQLERAMGILFVIVGGLLLGEIVLRSQTSL